MGHHTSRKLSYLLRHGANEAGLTMDPAGWVPVREILAMLDISYADLEAAVASNTKSRLELRADRVRCCQGHSSAGTPVTQDALEATWAPYEGDDHVWHGTFLDAVPNIATQGLLPGERTHVHLAPSLDSEVGKRANVHVGIEISVERVRDAGLEVFEAGNGVILVRRVPPSAFVSMRPLSRKAKVRERELWALLVRS